MPKYDKPLRKRSAAVETRKGVMASFVEKSPVQPIVTPEVDKKAQALRQFLGTSSDLVAQWSKYETEKTAALDRVKGKVDANKVSNELWNRIHDPNDEEIAKLREAGYTNAQILEAKAKEKMDEIMNDEGVTQSWKMAFLDTFTRRGDQLYRNLLNKDIEERQVELLTDFKEAFKADIEAGKSPMEAYKELSKHAKEVGGRELRSAVGGEIVRDLYDYVVDKVTDGQLSSSQADRLLEVIHKTPELRSNPKYQSLIERGDRQLRAARKAREVAAKKGSGQSLNRLKVGYLNSYISIVNSDLPPEEKQKRLLQLQGSLMDAAAKTGSAKLASLELTIQRAIDSGAYPKVSDPKAYSVAMDVAHNPDADIDQVIEISHYLRPSDAKHVIDKWQEVHSGKSDAAHTRQVLMQSINDFASTFDTSSLVKGDPAGKAQKNFIKIRAKRFITEYERRYHKLPDFETVDKELSRLAKTAQSIKPTVDIYGDVKSKFVGMTTGEDIQQTPKQKPQQVSKHHHQNPKEKPHQQKQEKHKDPLLDKLDLVP